MIGIAKKITDAVEIAKLVADRGLMPFETAIKALAADIAAGLPVKADGSKFTAAEVVEAAAAADKPWAEIQQLLDGSASK